MLKIIKNINMHEKFNNSWERLPGYLQGQQNQLAKRHLVKTEGKKYKLTNAQIDALLAKIMDNEVSEHIFENMPEPRMAYILNRRLFENAFEIASKNRSFSSTA